MKLWFFHYYFHFEIWFFFFKNKNTHPPQKNDKFWVINKSNKSRPLLFLYPLYINYHFNPLPFLLFLLLPLLPLRHLISIKDSRWQRMDAWIHWLRDALRFQTWQLAFLSNSPLIYIYIHIWINIYIYKYIYIFELTKINNKTIPVLPVCVCESSLTRLSVNRCTETGWFLCFHTTHQPVSFCRVPTSSAPPLPLPLSFPSPPSTSVDIPVYLVVETPLISMTWPVPSSDDDDDVIVHRDPSQPTNQPTKISKKKTKKKTNISSDVFLEREDGLIFHLIRVLMTLYSVVFDLFCRTRNKRNRIFDTDTRLIPGSC